MHTVKCAVCGERFDVDSEPGVKVNSTRYAHKRCRPDILKTYAPATRPKVAIASKTKEDKIKEERKSCIAYIQVLLGADNCDWGLITAQLSRMVKEYNYTYSGIEGTLRWYYEIEHHEIQEWNNVVGLVPFIYSQAKQYYLKINQAIAANEGKNINDFISAIGVVAHKPEHKHKKTCWDDEE